MIEKKLRKKQSNLPIFPTSGKYAFIPEGDLRLISIPLSKIKRLKGNPRKNKEAAIELAEEIREIGFRMPVAINVDYEIKAGDTRYQAAEILGMEMIPAVRSAYTDINQEWKYVLADNKFGEKSEWDRDALVKLLTSEEILPGDMNTGFSERELFKLKSFSDVLNKEGSEVDKHIIFSKDDIVDELFTEFREKGFPSNSISIAQCKQELNKLASMPLSSCINSVAGYRIADTFNPHRFEAKVSNQKTVHEAYNNDKDLRKALRMEYENHHGSSIFKYGFFGFLTLVNGTQTCSNFRPAFARMIYDMYAPKEGIVFDPSMGYGGRLVGFLSSHCLGYIGIDPSKITWKGNMNIASKLGKHKETLLYNDPIENFNSIVHKQKCDFAFTSPPYFSKEHYDERKDQSYRKFPEYSDWKHGFLRMMFVKVYTVLKTGKTFVLNIEDVKIGSKKYPLVNDSIVLGCRMGFQHIETKHFELPPRVSSDKNNKKTITEARESVIFFKKVKKIQSKR